MLMSETTTAYDLFIHEVTQAKSGTEIATGVKYVVADLQNLRENLRGEVAHVMPEQEIVVPASLRNHIDVGIVEDVRAGEKLQTIQDTLQMTAQDVKHIVGERKTDVLPGNIAGQAMQGMVGSSVIDVSSAAGPTSEGSLLSKDNLLDTVFHEKEHEEQAPEWNAESAQIVGGQTLTRMWVSEVAAMSVQQSVVWNSDEYQKMWQNFTTFASAEEAKEAARSGDLIGLADDINRHRDVPRLGR